jgi:hypothetical protein
VRAPRIRILAAAGALLLLSACQATVGVGVDESASGRGQVVVTVALDQEAAQTVPDLASQLRTGDLGKAGWKIEGPSPAPNHGVVVRATKPFANGAELARAVDQLSGTGPFHPFQSFQVVRHRSFFATRTRFQGKVDLTCGLRCFGDQQLQQQLGGSDLGFDPAQLQQLTSVILDRIFRFQVSVRLPGSVTSSNAPAQAGNGAVWSPSLGQQATLAASARQWDTRRIGLLAVALACVIALVAMTVVRRRPVGRHGRMF